jgi:hypothetical protein
MLISALVSLALLLPSPITRADLERAVALARFPHSDAERAQFHDRYLTVVGRAAGPVTTTPVAIQLQVITEFRRVELLVEEHDRVNDLFARGGTDDVASAMRPWGDKVSVGAYLVLPGGTRTPVPPVEIVVDGVGAESARPAARTAFHTSSDLHGATLADAVVDAVFDATKVGRTRRMVHVVVAGREIAHAAIDFSSLE